jgi:hypothetical protein
MVHLGGAAAAFDVCPLCGHNVDTGQAEQTRLRLREGLTLEQDQPADGTNP